VRKLAVVLAWAALLALLFSWPQLTAYLPTTNEGAAMRLNDRWSGVLRLWVCDEMWQPGGGSFVPWLNSCIERFERRHPGVYVQVMSVPLTVIRGFASGDINPPDMLLLAPGMLEDPAHLMALTPSPLTGESLAEAGQGRATAVALGGYGWALNRAYLQQAPVDWSALGDAPKPTKKNQRAFSWMDVPADGAFSSYSKAFLSLMRDREVTDEPAAPVKAGEGLNLGLGGEPEETPPPPTTRRVRAVLPKSLPADFRKRSSIISDFASGRTAAALVTQREVRRLESLYGARRAPDRTLEPAPYTDQIAFLAVVDLPRDDLAKRQSLSVKLIEHLLSDDSQKALSKIRAFRVTPGEALYASRTGYAQLERALSGGNVEPAAAFGSGFRSAACAAADAFVTHGGGT
jgi:hypothetical protein